MAETNLDQAERLITIMNEVNERFDAYTRTVRSEITRAIFRGDRVEAAMLDGALKSARKDVTTMERNLARVLLSSEVVDQLVGELEGVAGEADQLLADLAAHGKTLDRIKLGADIIAKAVKTVAKFVV